jgi:hypothetical protein
MRLSDEVLDLQHETRALTEVLALRHLNPETRLALVEELDALEARVAIARVLVAALAVEAERRQEAESQRRQELRQRAEAS